MGIYLDGKTTGANVISNVVDNVLNYSVFLQWGRYNVVGNNLLINTNDTSSLISNVGEQLFMTARTDDISPPYATSWQALTSVAAWDGFRGEDDDPAVDWAGGYRHGKHTITNNILVSANTAGGGQIVSVSQLNALNTFARNTYWHTSRLVSDSALFYHFPAAAPWTGTYSFAGWTNLWSGANEIFANPQINYGTYTLASGSPALANGFQPIDWESAGLYDDEFWGDEEEDIPEWPEPPLFGTRATLGGTANIQGTWTAP